MTRLPTHKLLFFSGCAVSLFLFLALGHSFAFPRSGLQNVFSLNEPTAHVAVQVDDGSMYDSSRVLNGVPTHHFRDNLRPDTKYITTWLSAGWTNDVMTFMNLIYLGLLTNRIPVLPVFIPSLISDKNGAIPVPFGEVFDVRRLSQSLRMPVLEWHDIKNISGWPYPILNNPEEMDELGCWSVWQGVRDSHNEPRSSFDPVLLSLDLSYTRAPAYIRLEPGREDGLHAGFWPLASLAFPEARQEALAHTVPAPSEFGKVPIPPDEQMLCYDYLFYVGASKTFEFDADYSPAWRFVGQYVRWAPRIEQIADKYIRRAFGVTDPGTPTPPWIAIHARHGDFSNGCPPSLTLEQRLTDCFASIKAISRRVEEVRSEILARKGVEVKHVVMTSDEKNAGWWEEVRAQGWDRIDLAAIRAEEGAGSEWFPVFIDAVVQSGSLGFVGNAGSTMSLIAKRRVESWHDGVVRMVKWGWVGADDL